MAAGKFRMALTNGLEISKEVLDAEIESFFDSAPPLKNRHDVSEKLEDFVKKNSSASGMFTSLIFYNSIEFLYPFALFSMF